MFFRLKQTESCHTFLMDALLDRYNNYINQMYDFLSACYEVVLLVNLQVTFTDLNSFKLFH
jgi:hypothetical protein